jgi:hypothetical protein
MITIHVTSDDLVKMRFAYRPLMEIPLSYRVLINPRFQSPYQWWVDETRRTLHDLEFPYLDALVPDMGYIPDFLTPTPTGNRTDIEADFEELLATPDDVIRKGILELIEGYGSSEIRQFFLAHPRDGIRCLVEDMRLYWQYTLAHYWSRMISVLEGDQLYRARTLALDGAKPLFEDLHPSIGFHNGEIQLQACCQYIHRKVEFQLVGNGIQIVPVIFRGCGRMFQVTPDWQPMLAYGVRGTGLWGGQQPNKSLELALGAGRAQVLQGLQVAATTGEVAHKLCLTSGAVSQHLHRLRSAGLVEPHRSGKRVYYQLTQRGEELIALFERMT